MVTELQQKMLDELDDMVKYYSEDTSRRAYISTISGCIYITKDGRKCAVGRKLPDEILKNKDFLEKFNSGCTYLDIRINVLKSDLLGLPSGFWTDIQRLHDSSPNWILNDLSETGKHLAEIIKDKIILGSYGK